jgi:5-deoxy-glucuronate isomerase
MGRQLHFGAQDWAELRSPNDLNLQYTTAQRIELSGTLSLDTAGEEVCLVNVGNAEASFRCGGTDGALNPKDMLYLPRKGTAEVNGSGATLIRFGAPAERDTALVHLPFAEMDKDPEVHRVFGKVETNCQRDAWLCLDQNVDADRLMVGICQGRTGGWTGWPPHEHTAQREEVYAYFDMRSAFGVQILYDDMDAPYLVAMVRDGDLVSIPSGYHPNVGCPGGRISFIYCMVAAKPGQRDFMDLHVQELFGDKFE